jgi:rubredoxin
MPRQWKCTVCGYIHEGPAPPPSCPRCGADRSEFIPLEAQKFNLLRDMADTFVLHAVAAHFPNGLLPTAAAFLILFLVTGQPQLESAAFSLVVVTVLVAPVSIASGIFDWRTKFAGIPAKIFYKKICLAVTLLLCGVSALWLRWGDPRLLARAGGGGALYLGLFATMLVCVVLLGHYGGKLVFKWKDSKL